MQFQIHAPSWDFSLGVHSNGLNSLLTINGYFYRILILHQREMGLLVATQHKHPFE